MSFSKIHSAQIAYLQPKMVDIEVDISRGLYSFSIIGLGDKAVEEAKDRVGSAIKNSGFKSPKQKSEKVTVSLAPAYSKKHGSLFDVGIALGYLEACGEIDIDQKNKRLFIGELALDGTLRYTHGLLPLTKYAKERGFTEIFVPAVNAKEAAIVSDIAVYGAETLWEIIQHVRPNNPKLLAKQEQTKLIARAPKSTIDFSDIKGQQLAKRGLTIAAAGGHNIALYGPPGTGKTLLAKAFKELFPEMDKEEMLAVTAIYSAAGLLSQHIITERPFRSPHHSASYVAMCGGGSTISPGEITLAHNGILFLDELPEFERKVIESLRQPLEDGVICISRASGTATYPANFTLIATLNPCPCGYKDSNTKSCTCSPGQIHKYMQKISGPIADRIDMWIEVGSIDHNELITKSTATKPVSKQITNVIKATHDIQKERQQQLNANLTSKTIEQYCQLQPEVIRIIKEAATKLELSARSVHKLIKIARTIADLDNAEHISDTHILEALQFRKKMPSH